MYLMLTHYVFMSHVLYNTLHNKKNNNKKLKGSYIHHPQDAPAQYVS